jgi:membrane fusion protein (multidrug efflux system)
VKPGPRVGNLWVLEEGVKPGEKVIVEGMQKVRDGMVVEATVAAGEPAPAAPQAPPAPAAASPTPVPAASR